MFCLEIVVMELNRISKKERIYCKHISASKSIIFVQFEQRKKYSRHCLQQEFWNLNTWMKDTFCFDYSYHGFQRSVE